MKRGLAGVALAALVAAAPGPAAAQSGAEAWWAHVQALAHDSMLGRHTGSPQHRQAAEYVADVFRSAGLAPGGTDGFFQPVRLTLRRIDESRSSLALVRGSAVEPLALGQDAYFNLRAPLAERVEAPVVFAGYGLRIPEYGHDDLAGLDVRGKIVAYLSAAPAGIPGPVVSDARSRQWEWLRAAGAVGTVVVFDATRGRDYVWRRAAASRLIPQMTLADATLDALGGQQIAVVVNAARGAELFRGTPHTLAALAARADSGLPLPQFALPVAIRAVVATMTADVVSDNVVGILRGGDPVRRDEYVVLTAHLDHVGVSTPVDGDSIYNGAMDNASGTATLLEAARALVRQPSPPARSVVFLAVTAEEKGLLGSRHWANHPTVPGDAVVANLNTDMFLPINPLRSVIVNGIEESDLADDVRAVAAAVGLAALPDPEPERNAFVRSDQYSFIRQGVPAVSLKAGFTRGTPEHVRVLEFRAERYHAPSDDPSQPVDLQAAAEFNRFYISLVGRVADRATRPAWNADSYFRTRPAIDATGH